MTLLLVLLALFLSSAVVEAGHCGGSVLTGCYWNGEDWAPGNGGVIGGTHTGIRTFTINPGVTVYVSSVSSGGTGWVDITAQTILINGSLDGNHRGYEGGGGGGGGGGGRFCTGGYGGGGPGGPSSGGSSGGNPGGNSPVNGQISAAGGHGGGGGGPAGGFAGGGAGLSGGPGNPGGHAGHGGYAVQGGQGDTTTDTSIRLGSGGGGAGGGSGGACGNNCCQESGGGGGGGGAGNPGGAAIGLQGTGSVIINGSVVAVGAAGVRGNGGAGFQHNADWPMTDGGNGGYAYHGGSSAGGGGGPASGGCPPVFGNPGGPGGNGGYGAGGGVRIMSLGAQPIALNGHIDVRGGGYLTFNGGTIKMFTVAGRMPGGMNLNVAKVYAGRFYGSESLIHRAARTLLHHLFSRGGPWWWADHLAETEG